MKRTNSKKSIKAYGLIGKFLSGCAGGIVGFVLGGPILAIPGSVAGIAGGHLLEKGLAL